MKRGKLLLCLVLAVCLLSSLSVSAFAEGNGGEEYQYTVRLYEGNYGEDTGVRISRVVGTWTVPYNGSAPVGGGLSQTPVDGTKYVIRGVKEAGKDSSDIFSVGYTLNNVTKDVDFVIAYGIEGSMVRYTVTYSDAEGNPLNPEDADGNPLPSSETFYGTPGDAVIVGYRQVTGYQPQAYNLRKTLTANEAENVFPFIYTPIPEPAEPPVAPEGEEVVTDEANVNIPDGGVPAAAGPADLIDLDEDETPLGLLDMGKDAIENGAELFGRLPFGARLGLVAMDVILIGLLIWLLVRRKNKKKEQEQST